MQSLAELQRQFIAALFRYQQDQGDWLDIARRSAQQQINIYRSSYQGGMQKVLAAIYPVCRRLLGDDFFNAMCLQYIRSTPCRSHDINHYGDTLAHFIQSFPALAELPYLADVARLEWAWHIAYQAPASPQANLNPLLEMSPQKLLKTRLRLHPSMSLLDSPYPVDQIWNANQEEDTSDTQPVDLNSGPCFLAIWRNGVQHHIDSLQHGFYSFLTAIQAQTPLGQLQQSIPDTSQYLINGLARGYFYAFDL